MIVLKFPLVCEALQNHDHVKHKEHSQLAKALIYRSSEKSSIRNLEVSSASGHNNWPEARHYLRLRTIQYKDFY